MLFNDVIAIRHVCSNPQAVIVTLDADDQLLRHDALRMVLEAHTQVRRSMFEYVLLQVWLQCNTPQCRTVLVTGTPTVAHLLLPCSVLQPLKSLHNLCNPCKPHGGNTLTAQHLLHLQGGHDFVTAGHIRTDKTHCAPGYNTGPSCVTFAGPHRQQQLRGGGNVWQHLRSFRKQLFDAVPDARLRMWEDPAAAAAVGPASSSSSTVCPRAAADCSATVKEQQQQLPQAGPGSIGYYYELANDWAFCIPMADLAVKPGVLPAALYLYEPSCPRQDRPAREAVIGACSAIALQLTMHRL
jgi:hypothetical protein